MGKSDETLALLNSARTGNATAVEALFERLLPRVRRIVALRMGQRESELWEREDLVQETLLEAFRDIATFAPQGEGALCNWLATMVKNNLNDHRRRRKAARRDVRRRATIPERSTFLSEAFFGADTETPSRLASATELEERIEAVLLGLSEPKRRAFELRRLCQLSFEEIAKELELGGPSSARSLYSRAMAELADQL